MLKEKKLVPVGNSYETVAGAPLSSGLVLGMLRAAGSFESVYDAGYSFDCRD